MAQPQKGINAEPNLHAIHLLFNVVEDDVRSVRTKLAQLLALFEQYENDCYEAMISGVIGVGAGYWMELYRDVPKLLTPFPDFASDEREVAVMPVDLMIILRSDRLDVCYEMSHAVCQCLGSSVELLDQINTFRFYDGRDLSGFVLAPTAPQRHQKMKVSVVGDEDATFAGGSYLHLQRVMMDVRMWNTLSLEEQESIKGVTKLEGKRNHKNTYADKLLDLASRFVQHSMPFGDINTQGVLFLSCAKSPQYFHQYLEYQLLGDDGKQYDESLDFVSSLQGSAFFAPSIDYILAQAPSDDSTESNSRY